MTHIVESGAFVVITIMVLIYLILISILIFLVMIGAEIAGRLGIIKKPPGNFNSI